MSILKALSGARTRYRETTTDFDHSYNPTLALGLVPLPVALAMLTDRPNQFHGWLKLPTELKLEVLSHHLTIIGELDGARHLQAMSNEIDAIIRTNNRELVTLALETYYKLNVFYASLYPRRSGRFIMDHPPVAHARIIKHLYVFLGNCDLSFTPENVLISRASGWRYLCTPPQPQKDSAYPATMGEVVIPESLEWQSLFRNLTTLHLSLGITLALRRFIVGSKLCSGCCVEMAQSEQLLDWLAYTSTGITALKVTVTAERQGVLGSLHFAPRKCTHIETLEAMVLRMIKKA